MSRGDWSVPTEPLFFTNLLLRLIPVPRENKRKLPIKPPLSSPQKKVHSLRVRPMGGFQRLPQRSRDPAIPSVCSFAPPPKTVSVSPSSSSAPGSCRPCALLQCTVSDILLILLPSPPSNPRSGGPPDGAGVRSPSTIHPHAVFLNI